MPRMRESKRGSILRHRASVLYEGGSPKLVAVLVLFGPGNHRGCRKARGETAILAVVP